MFELKVPATSANLGPGYDTLGIALSLFNSFKIKRRKDAKIIVKVVDKRKDEIIKIPAEDNLIIKAYKKYFDYLGEKIIGAEIIEEMNTPLARGLGSSSSAIIGGLAAAAFISGDLVSEKEFIQLAVEIEKHPDNVVPALVGGLTINFYCKDGYDYYKIDVDNNLDFILAVPDFELQTEKLREVLPEKIDYSEVISNLGRISLLTAAFMNQEYQLLKTAMEDQLHQPFRKNLIKGFDQLLKTAYQNGAYGAALSGAGPTIITITSENQRLIAKKMKNIFKSNSIQADCYIVKASNENLYQRLNEEISKNA